MCSCLPIKEPLVTCYKHHALPLSIVEATMHIPPEQILYYYLQLCTQFDILGNPNCNPHWLDFYQEKMLIDMDPNPFFDIQKFKSYGIEKDNFINLIETSIEQGYYVYLTYDGFYLNTHFSYQKNTELSNLLVYGYNKQTQECDVYDYDYVKAKRLNKLKFDINVLYNATFKAEVGLKTKWAENIVILRPKATFKQDLNISGIKDTLSDYISPRKIVSKYESYKTYGLNVYKVIEEYLNGVITGTHYFSIPPFSALWDHKKCITYMVKKMFKAAEILNPIVDIEKSVLTVRNMGVRYLLTNEPEIFGKMLLNLKKIQMQESQELQKIVNLL